MCTGGESVLVSVYSGILVLLGIMMVLFGALDLSLAEVSFTMVSLFY